MKKSKSIAVVTFSRNASYGGSLQEFALFIFLKDKYKVECLDYVNPIIRANSKAVRTSIFSAFGIIFKRIIAKRTKKEGAIKKKNGNSFKLSYYLRDGLNLLGVFFSDMLNYKTRKLQINAFKQFWKEYIVYSPPYTEKELFDSPPASYDVYLSGSDQIWNPIKFGLSRVYFLCFVPSGVRKISYASSFANFHFDDSEQSSVIIEYLKSYNAVSVREEHSCKELMSLGISVAHVLDPTLLQTKSDWIKSLSLKNEESRDPYVVAYAMNDHIKLYEYAKKVANALRMNLKVIGMKNRKNSPNLEFNVEYFPCAGPREFVSLFANASFAVTNSFHGTAFSVNFNIPFICLESNLPERIISLLNLTNLFSRQGSFKDNDAKIKDWNTDVDFSHANNVLNTERKIAIDYLEKAINFNEEINE